MTTPPVAIRCPACGTELKVVLAPAPPTQWFPCPQCRQPVPVVVPRDPPPLYSWEVYPGLYPNLPLPRRPRIRMRRVVQASLVAVAVVSVALAGVLVLLATEATAPAQFSVSGTVYEAHTGGVQSPAVGATVVLTYENSPGSTEETGVNGGFSFVAIPAGGITLNISALGYAPVTVTTFATSVYNAGTTGLMVTLSPGTNANGTSVALSPFPDLESLLASLGSGAAILGIVAIIGGIAALLTGRSDRPAVGVVGGSAGLLAPVALYFLALGTPFPIVLEGSAALAALGAFVTTTRAFEILRFGPSAG